MNRKHRNIGLALLALISTATAVRATPSASFYTEFGDISDVSGWAIVAEARCGSNGNYNLPDLDYDLIDPSWNGDGGYLCWDPTLYNGFHSGADYGVMTADLVDGTASFVITDVDNNVSEADYEGCSGTIQKVVIRAAVEASGEAQWDGPGVNFYSDNVCVESYFSMSGPLADTTTGSEPVEAQTLTVTPTDSTDTKVVVSGDFNFSSSDSNPSPNDMFTQVFLFTN